MDSAGRALAKKHAYKMLSTCQTDEELLRKNANGIITATMIYLSIIPPSEDAAANQKHLDRAAELAEMGILVYHECQCIKARINMNKKIATAK